MRIARIAGIPIRLHWSFLAIVAVLVLWELGTGGLLGVASGVMLGVALFGSVVLHELGHALTARAFGIGTAHITLYPFGGIAAIKGLPNTWWSELLIAIAGPAVNFVLFAAFLPAYMLTAWWPIGALAGINLVMGVFNLVPAFPMDGGRVLRAVLSVGLGYWRASEVAIVIGRVFAVAFALIGLVTWQVGLLIVGVFLWFATGMERQRLQMMREMRFRPRWRWDRAA